MEKKDVLHRIADNMKATIRYEPHPTWTYPLHTVIAYLFDLCPSVECFKEAFYKTSTDSQDLLNCLYEVDGEYSKHSRRWTNWSEDRRAEEIVKYLKAVIEDFQHYGAKDHYIAVFKQALGRLRKIVQQLEEKEGKR